MVSASPTAATRVSLVGLASRTILAARHSGHQAHSGASPGAGSWVAVSQTSPDGWGVLPRAVRTWSVKFPAHAAGTGPQQPALEVTNQVIARPAWLCHLLSSPSAPWPGRLSTRFFSPLRAVSMIVFSARRFSSPGIGIRMSTDSS